MMTNWMVNYRPDIYVRWWHPRNKYLPLESEILWNGNISLIDFTEYEPTKNIQYKAKTEFTFKTWTFSGLNDINDSDQLPEHLIQYIYINSQDDKINYVLDNNPIKYPDLVGYPSIGNLNTDTGTFVVEPTAEFDEFIENINSGLITDITEIADLSYNDIYKSFPNANIFQAYTKIDNLINEQLLFKYCYFYNR